MREFTTLDSLVKICGVTSPADARVVADAGADALGVILTASRRRVDADAARSVTEAARGRLVTFGVVDTGDRASLDAVVEGVGVDVVQVHGELRDDLLATLRDRHLGVVKVLAIGSEEFATFDEMLVDAVLVDGPTPGSGVAHSFAGVRERHFARPVIAAGGLTSHSVASVINAHDVWGVDVASGVESAPGVKDPLRVVEFVEAARRAFAAREPR
ncbi:MAG: phosphoribosylanthranilate isomerase [Acidimicrobiales bacterium]